MGEITNVLMCGVGGQGVLLASELLIEVARTNGFEVRKSEVHGMAQRGGSVSSHIRFGKNVYSPIIPAGQTDFILAFEYVEALRYLDMANKKTTVFLNSHKLIPTTVFGGGPAYPENVVEELKKNIDDVVSISALEKAEELGNSRAENVILLAAFATRLQFEKESWLNVLKLKLKPKIVELNLKAFELGWSLVK